MSYYVEACHCGHDKATHHEQSGPCLGMHCNDCQCFVHRDDPDRPERKKPTPQVERFDDAIETPLIPRPWWNP